MPDELDLKIAERLVFSAICDLPPTPGNKINCTRGVLKKAILRVLHEAHEIGRMASAQERLSEFARRGSVDRPAWMDIRLDNAEGLAAHVIRFQQAVLKSLLGAGYRCIGDRRWVPNRELKQLPTSGLRPPNRSGILCRD